MSELAIENIKAPSTPTPKVEHEGFGSFFGDDKNSRIEHSFGESKKYLKYL